MQAKLPVPVLKGPHWRVNFRPQVYKEELIPSLQRCVEIIEQTKLSIRGWDYPHFSRRDLERELGQNWIASWSDFRNRNEYWRFYQSGQFLHLFGIDETDPEWHAQLRGRAKSQVGWGEKKDLDWSQIPGFFSVLNFLYTFTEIFEFAARLCEKGVYESQISISVEIKGIRGFVLTHERNRAWMNYYCVTQDELSRAWEIEPKDLVAQSRQYSLVAVKWFFERFGWLNPSEEVLKNDQENFLARRL
jgi:hypothetical protein